MSLNIDEQEARLIWLNDIMPFVFRHAKTQEKPVTVFLGGQPAAGKTSGQDLAEGALNGARFALWVLRDLLDGGSQEC